VDCHLRHFQQIGALAQNDCPGRRHTAGERGGAGVEEGGRVGDPAEVPPRGGGLALPRPRVTGAGAGRLLVLGRVGTAGVIRRGRAPVVGAGGIPGVPGRAGLVSVLCPGYGSVPPRPRPVVTGAGAAGLPVPTGQVGLVGVLPPAIPPTQSLAGQGRAGGIPAFPARVDNFDVRHRGCGFAPPLPRPVIVRAGAGRGGLPMESGSALPLLRPPTWAGCDFCCLCHQFYILTKKLS